MPPKKKTANAEPGMNLQPLDRGRISFCILGLTGLIINAMSEKTRQELLFPRGRSRRGSGTLKHDPMREFTDSAYKSEDLKSPTFLQHLASAFKCAMALAARDLGGTSKAEIERLLWVEGERVSIYGVPQMMMAVTRSADMNRTPDIRTRCIIPKWACEITVSYIRPNLTDTDVANLLAAAGLTQGIGDWRNGKGKGTFGSFMPTTDSNPDFKHLLKTGGRKVQVEAMENPDFYDDETRKMFLWFKEEVASRGRSDQLAAPEENGENGHVEAEANGNGKSRRNGKNRIAALTE